MLDSNRVCGRLSDSGDLVVTFNARLYVAQIVNASCSVRRPEKKRFKTLYKARTTDARPRRRDCLKAGCHVERTAVGAYLVFLAIRITTTHRRRVCFPYDFAHRFRGDCASVLHMDKGIAAGHILAGLLFLVG